MSIGSNIKICAYILLGDSGDKAVEAVNIKIQGDGEKNGVDANVKIQKSGEEGASNTRPNSLKSTTKGWQGSAQSPKQWSGNRNEEGTK